MHFDLFKSYESPQALPSMSEKESLDELLERYPWFATAQLFKAKAMVNTNDPESADQIQKTAVFLNDRTVLFDIVNRVDADQSVQEEAALVEEEVEEAEEIVQEEVNEKLPLLKQVEEEQIDEEPVKESCERSIEERTEDSEDQLIESEEPASNPALEVVEEEAAPEAEEEEVATVEEEEESKETSELDKEILTMAVSRVIEQEVQEQFEDTSIGQTEEVATSTPLQEEEGLSPFARMLLQSAAKVGYGDSAGFTEQQSVEETVEENKNKSNDELLDQFIRTSPRITPSKVEEYSTNDLAKKSLVADDSFVTETMAQIYAKQGKIDKARKAYKLLSLKYPEKSVYFASQLKKLTSKK